MKVDIIIADTFKNQSQDLIVGTYLRVQPRWTGDTVQHVIIRKMWVDTHDGRHIIECADPSTAFGQHVSKWQFENGKVEIEPELISIHALPLMVGERVDMEPQYHYGWRDYKIIELKKQDDVGHHWCGGQVEYWMLLMSQYPFRHTCACYLSRNNSVLHIAFPA